MLPTGQRDVSKEELRLMWKLAGLAFTFGTEIIAGVLLGWGFDALFNTRPYGVVTGSIVGIAVGLTDFIRRSMQINRQMPIPTRFNRPGAVETKSTARVRPKAQAGELGSGEIEEGELTHEQWKALRDLGLDTDDDDGKPIQHSGSSGPRNPPRHG